ncbi:permease-like cell division protein FtsX [Salirhabdus salicampi]|uniref:permease-like cell division protein FtsX n=1 Tax=Salirhabdus salicampi TaxID=476102 RepID=UPI0020C39F5F|nr:permease-like cell division protein FtsX [Salirhabdus salicampi]MCP8617617.1 permease-like cell division protein FtsX [Salirhabdus salicampi]
MKLRTVRRHIREGSKNIVRNGWMTVASIGAVTTTLVLVGVFIAIMMNINQMATNVEKDVQIKVLIDLTAGETERTQLEKQITDIPEVSTVEYSSKDDELQSLMESMGDAGEVWSLFEQDNPLNDAFIVKTTNPIDTIEVARQVEDFANVSEVVYAENVVKKMFTFNEYARYIGIGLIGALVLMAIFLISNTIKITITARKKEIGIMKLVGATNGFIRWPFFIEGLLMGVLGSIIPIAVVMTGYHYVYYQLKDRITLPFIELLPFTPFAWQLSGMLLAIGGFIGIWGSIMSVRKFLKV